MESLLNLEGLDLRRYFRAIYGGDFFRPQEARPHRRALPAGGDGADADETLRGEI
jgi:hypothetical protein